MKTPVALCSSEIQPRGQVAPERDLVLEEAADAEPGAEPSWEGAVTRFPLRHIPRPRGTARAHELPHAADPLGGASPTPSTTRHLPTRCYCLRLINEKLGAESELLNSRGQRHLQAFPEGVRKGARWRDTNEPTQGTVPRNPQTREEPANAGHRAAWQVLRRPARGLSDELQVRSRRSPHPRGPDPRHAGISETETQGREW